VVQERGELENRRLAKLEQAGGPGEPSKLFELDCPSLALPSTVISE
jgi:hypothetical protein